MTMEAPCPGICSQPDQLNSCGRACGKQGWFISKEEKEQVMGRWGNFRYSSDACVALDLEPGLTPQHASL